ncbi:hypothetical protein CJ030_MR3G001309 [Morella rubra]|uniref:Uncharacterized protein n=1 Tax=Morella rubra TaxID=262757 RepID=A0A6A1W671_9ROSI|nr:hypothetical protein CJ030_MR3G001309 [Morella rubra]
MTVKNLKAPRDTSHQFHLMSLPRERIHLANLQRARERSHRAHFTNLERVREKSHNRNTDSHGHYSGHPPVEDAKDSQLEPAGKRKLPPPPPPIMAPRTHYHPPHKPTECIRSIYMGLYLGIRGALDVIISRVSIISC